MTDREIKVYNLNYVNGRFSADAAADCDEKTAMHLNDVLNANQPFALIDMEGEAYLIRPWPVQGVRCIELESIHTFDYRRVVATGWVSNGYTPDRKKVQVEVSELIKTAGRKIVPMESLNRQAKAA
jgi:hypothetical protein